MQERYWHDVADFELLLRAHTDERGALLAKIDRAGQRLQLLKNTSVLYDAFKIWWGGGVLGGRVRGGGGGRRRGWAVGIRHM